MHPDIPVCCTGCEPEVKGGKAVLSLPLDAGYGVIYIFCDGSKNYNSILQCLKLRTQSRRSGGKASEIQTGYRFPDIDP